ncbi:hypothetical protein ISN44_As02g005550 [Arabidopsis suecica]|uniref:Uncharacterized protein n=1 Tax=Arabidopsis suecica TaxID=45249 RepID=A0A8T2FZJ2_ARASU|nr:hypothetical protein ISN44_As02g005550 [Arabidopsis suecica]
MPAELLAKIVSLVSENGVEDLKSWIRSGHAGKDAVLSKETLKRVGLDKSGLSAYMEFIDGRLCIEDPLIGELVTNPPLKRAGRPKCPICKKNGHMCLETSVRPRVVTMGKKKRMGNIVDINQDVLDKIVSIIARDRVDVLKSWMNTRRAGKKAVYSPATLSSVRLDLNENFVQCLKLGFRNLDLDGAISVMNKVQHTYLVAALLLIMLQSCVCTLMEKNYWKFRDKFNVRRINVSYKHNRSQTIRKLLLHMAFRGFSTLLVFP